MNRETDKRVCRRCLVREMADSQETFRTLQELIENLSSDVRAEDTLYEYRLQICRQCDRLFAGMCRGCGCYVELRAAVAKNSCPYHNW
ncbi:MAG: DUF6171 family protein [Roseburia sp.]|nr:DUF6171 family protein [Roseburia sp.]